MIWMKLSTAFGIPAHDPRAIVQVARASLSLKENKNQDILQNQHVASSTIRREVWTQKTVTLLILIVVIKRPVSIRHFALVVCIQ